MRKAILALTCGLSLASAGCFGDVAIGGTSDATLDAPIDARSDGPVPADATLERSVPPAEGGACSASTCPLGCCDSTGTCVTGESATACGTGGASCIDCSKSGEICSIPQGTEGGAS